MSEAHEEKHDRAYSAHIWGEIKKEVREERITAHPNLTPDRVVAYLYYQVCTICGEARQV